MLRLLPTRTPGVPPAAASPLPPPKPASLAQRAAAAALAAAAIVAAGPPVAAPLWAASAAEAPVAAAAAAPAAAAAGAQSPGLDGARQRRLAEVAAAVERDFVEGQYYVTGNLTPSLYEPDALFVDPTTRVQGVEKYTAAVAALFDPAASRADLVSIAQDPAAGTITLRWRLEGALQLLGGRPIKPYTGTTVYTLDDAGLIASHVETWDITAADAFISTFLPSYGAPPAPPVSELRQQ